MDPLTVWTLISTAFLVGEFIYNYVTREDPKLEKPEAQRPTVEPGGAINIIYGRVRVEKPILVWCGPATYVEPNWRMNMFFVAGMGFQNDLNTGIVFNRVHGMWVGEKKMIDIPTLQSQTGAGGFVETSIMSIPYWEDVNADSVGGFAQWYDGNPNQQFESGGTPKNTAAQTMMFPPPTGTPLSGPEIPSYRGMMSIFLHGGGSPTGWQTGRSNTIQNYSFEVSSYQSGSGYPAVGIYAVIGMDSNPMNVVYDLIVGKFGRLGIDKSYIDMSSFQAAAITLHNESNGYSRVFDSRRAADDMIGEIMAQINGVLYEDPADSKFKIRLIRNDYVLDELVVIDKNNCNGLHNFSATGWEGLCNKVRVNFKNRAIDYRDDSITAGSMANATGQDGEIVEEVVAIPGCCEAGNAQSIAEREFAARSRPMMKMSANVDRSLATLTPGQPIRLYWEKPRISGLVFRVAGMNKGSLASGKISIDLVQDTFYVYSNNRPLPPSLVSDQPQIIHV